MATDRILYSNNDYEIRPARSVNEYRNLWWRYMVELGWNRGYFDIDTYMNPSHGSGMLLLIHKGQDKRRICGHVAAVINANNTGWLSLFVVGEEHRGKGMGGKLFEAAMEDFREHGTEIMGLDGVAEQKATYERRGFVDSPLGTVRIMTRPLVEKVPLPTRDGEVPGHFIQIYDVPLHLLAQHEQKYTGFQRPALWSNEHLFERDDIDGVALASTDNPQTVNDLQGWTIIRRSLHGPRIGPLYAENAEVAQAVLERAIELANVKFVDAVHPDDPYEDMSEAEIAEKAYITAEVWGGNPEAVKVFEQAGWTYAGVSYHRMWVGGKATPEFSEGGAAQQGVFAMMDAATG
ncbi:hypothetical protein LTR78_001977 [Recurvomyces mirabilis]|uniref:N-acetyltransferase domain-containing protein n=1 Tax=Recurvomyces mirabilis TaxID=574656 RepID=A0AAE1C4K5_9PEZI|nr:hypothetical protein LTR78_001977 [Recurvomyces mirabilis]KAK5160435.1 hypothetical protein LTS14_001447 [Recurvomyces mirabilis]